MPLKSAEERIDSMEKTIRIYRLLVFCLFMLILLIERERVVQWVDTVEGWLSIR